MPLTFHLDAIRDHEATCFVPVPADAVATARRNGPAPDGYEMNPVTEALVLMTMHVGMPKITAANAIEFFARTCEIEDIHGTFVSTCDDEGIRPRPLTLADVRAHIGLATNASPIGMREFKRLTRVERSAIEARQGTGV